jgi:polysaccharide deacetylase family protein (PEP-CTERM system associated)
MEKLSDFQNVLSFDVEEWFHVRRTEDYLPLERWSQLPGRLSLCLEQILELLRVTGNHATFFWLGWCAEQYPQWVRRVAEAGHEIACHGYGHRALDRMTPDEFRAELRRTRALLEDAGGRKVCGFRAPSLSLGPATAWMFDVLIEEGFDYDSSLLVTPLRFNKPGAGTAARLPEDLRRCLGQSRPWTWQTGAGKIVELPISICRWAGINLPFAGGLFFRIAPYRPVAATIARLNREGVPAVLYAHPWEFDLDSPLPPWSWIERFSHYFRRAAGRRKYVRLFNLFTFSPAAAAAERCHQSRETP